MDIGIIGGGSLGLLLSSYLSQIHEITLYVRRRTQLERIRHLGIRLQEASRFKHSVKINVQLIDHLKEHDLTFITVKQPQVQAVVNRLQALQKKHTLIFLQNGMGHLERLSELDQPIFLGVVEHGANRINDNEVNHLGIGRIRLATFNKESFPLKEKVMRLNSRLFPFELVEDWRTLLRKKLIINAVINPLTALFNVANGAIVENSHLRSLASALCEEAAIVLALDPVQAWGQVVRVAKNTKDNTSSMRADILANRQTEIEAISGYLLKQAEGYPMPYTSFVYQAILALEERGQV